VWETPYFGADEILAKGKVHTHTVDGKYTLTPMDKDFTFI
jgi:hypothetical protein